MAACPTSRHLQFSSHPGNSDVGYETNEVTRNVFSLNQGWICFISMCVVMVLLLVVNGCLFWETCIRKVYGKPMNRNRNRTPSNEIYRKPSLKNTEHSSLSLTVKTPLRKKHLSKKLSVRFSDELESTSLSKSRSWSDSVSYDDSNVSDVFMVNTQAAFSPYHLTYTTPLTSTDNVDTTNLFNCECSPVDDESGTNESPLGSSYCTTSHNLSDDQKDSGHCVDDDDDNTSNRCSVKIDMFLSSSSMSSSSSDNTNSSDCDKGIGSLDTSPCVVDMDSNNDMTPWMRNVTEKPLRRLSTPKPEQHNMDGSYLAPVNSNICSSRSSTCSLESSLMWDSYPYHERVDTSLSWDHFPLNGLKNTNDLDDMCN